MVFRRRFLALSALVLLPLSGCASGSGSLPPLPQTAAADSEYRLASGDEIRVFVYGLDPLNNTFMITDRGRLALPLIDPIDAAGMTVSQLEHAISEKLIEKQIVKQPNVNVQPLKMRPFYILGEVHNPGEYPYRHGLTVLSAVSIAGGYTYRADKKHMAITRTVGDHQTVGRADPSTPVEPGDTIRIDEKWF
ncbi:MAG TPA: polysaccharide biosynthesis/export family protein [Sphingomonas sp.]|nr:polysaccharide biosynthesis/export family protein [Sphingomonas sp.]